MTFRFPPKFPRTLARRPFLLKSLLSVLSLIGPGVLYVLFLLGSRLVGLPDDSPLSVGLSILFFIAAIVLMFWVFLYIVGLSGSRCRSIGLSAWWCLIYFIPYANLLFFLFLALWPPRSDSSVAAAEAPAVAAPSANAPTGEPAVIAASPDVEPATSPTQAEPSSKKVIKSAVGILIIVGAIAAGRLISTALTSPGGGTVEERAQTLLTSKEEKEYVSTDHGFRVVFPGFPEIERDTIDVQGNAVPYTSYLASIDPDADVRAVFVYDYSVATDDPAQIDLEGALNGMVQNTDGGELISTSVASLNGVEGIEGYYRSSVEGQVMDSYARLAKQGTKLYVTWSMGVSKFEFDAFATSFRFDP